ncbi:hypothetical protein KEM60_03140 [Austwickia sp. TVS 96-490-7B]|uniref:hypothetical protein n=1 Tax=Austwickia sp. TVS 96-490-7B TaxID=2830843 RepID=UPI001C5838F1|nr:hypothetical protein [Austwickia sp. TVS 96-490-7B]MBW3086911.1 hypothetical protein [Austwickia sp. TVS 96-490-7B]
MAVVRRTLRRALSGSVVIGVCCLLPMSSARAVETPTTSSGRLSAPTSSDTPPSSTSLPVTQIPQIKKYYCGPASGEMIARAVGATTSRADGAPLSQEALAAPGYMDTDREEATKWKAGTFVTGLNRWLGAPLYTQVDKPTGEQAWDALHSVVGVQKRPIAADAVEIAGGVHYNGHPVDRTIGHWIVGYAYDDAKGTSTWTDPAYNAPTVSWYRSVQAPTVTVDTEQFAADHLQYNGIAR